jgi:ribulose 1,5-bisphosphate synthetase/thiazole synthase
MQIPQAPVQHTYTCDVLVIGSGVSGYCAAIQAARCGCEVILLEKDEVLGGNSGPNLGVGITGADRYNAYATETGIVHELQEEAAWVGGFTGVAAGTMPYNISRRYEAVVQAALEQAGVRVLKRHYARLPLVQDGSISGVIVEDLAAFETVRVDVRDAGRGGTVIAASGDGHIAALAGAEYDVGSEAQAEYGERSAPVERTEHVQGTSLVAIAHCVDRPVPFIPPPGTPPYQPRVWQGSISSTLRHTHDGWFERGPGPIFLYITETGGHLDTIADDAQIYEMLLGQLWAEWDHIKNGPHADQARCWDLLWISPKAGKRESRRFLGDYVLTQADLEEGRRFADDVAYGGHDLDDHQPLGESADIVAHSIPPLYGIPYRACYSRNVDNLYLAGRLISATHLAHASSRVMRTGGAIGQAVGMAAALCRELGCTPRDLYHDSERLNDLQQCLLRADATLLARPAEAQGDLARCATVSASSELSFNDQRPGSLVSLIADAGNLLWDWPARLEQIELYLVNDTPAEQPLRVSLCRARRKPRWKSWEAYHDHGWNDLHEAVFRPLAAVDASLPPLFAGWYVIAFPEPLDLGDKDPASDDDRLLVSLARNPAICWAVVATPGNLDGPDEMLDSVGAYACARDSIARMVERSPRGTRWQEVGAMGAIRFTPAPHLGEAQNAANGYHRRFSRAPTHMWISDPASKLPAHLDLSWSEPQCLDRVDLTFDNLCASRHDNPWESGTRVAPWLVRSYVLAVREGGEWREIVRVEDNHHRFRRHTFAPLSSAELRLTVHATHGPGHPARVYQISAYHSASLAR